MGFNNLAAQSASVRAVGNGSMVLALNARAANDRSLSLGTPSFALSTTYGGASHSKTLTNYLITISLSPAGTGGTTTTSVNGTLSSSAFEFKSIAIATPVSFARSGTQAYPERFDYLQAALGARCQAALRERVRRP